MSIANVTMTLDELELSIDTCYHPNRDQYTVWFREKNTYSTKLLIWLSRGQMEELEARVSQELRATDPRAPENQEDVA